MQKQVMRRAWELKRAGWAATIGECLRAAWAEAKGLLTIVTAADVYEVETAEAASVPPAIAGYTETTWRRWWLGWLATAG